MLPSKAEAYPWNINTVTDRDFSVGPPIEIVEELCSILPDDVSISGNIHASVQHLASVPNTSHTFDTMAVVVPAQYNPDGLSVVATFNRVGLHRKSSREVGCRVYVSNPVKARSDSRQCLIHFDRFWSTGYAIGMWNIESMDVEWEFFYTDNPSECISFLGLVTTISSLNGNAPIFYPGTRHEGLCLPDNVTEIYKVENARLVIDGTLSGRQTYEHVIYGVPPSPTEDIYRLTGISWLSTTDNIRAKMIEVNDGIFGFNVTMQPITNETPNNPVKRNSISS